MGGVGTLGVVACVQEVAVTPGELLADADLIHYTMVFRLTIFWESIIVIIQGEESRGYQGNLGAS